MNLYDEIKELLVMFQITGDEMHEGNDGSFKFISFPIKRKFDNCYYRAVFTFVNEKFSCISIYKKVNDIDKGDALIKINLLNQLYSSAKFTLEDNYVAVHKYLAFCSDEACDYIEEFFDSRSIATAEFPHFSGNERTYRYVF